MTSAPLVSVIIPVYNGTNYLAEAVESVFQQTYPNIELLIVDDGSTDGTWELIQSFGDRVKGLRKENGGVASAMNRGIVESSGRYIAWLSHDDLFLPEKLSQQVAFLHRAGDCRACFTDYAAIDARGHRLRSVRTPELPRNQLRRHLFGRMFINGSTMVIARDCFDEIGLFREDLRTTQDAEMWFRILDLWNIGRVAEILGLQRVHPEQGSHDEGPHIRDKQALYTEIFQRLGAGGLFPDRSWNPETPRASACAHVWLGDTMATHRYWFDFADQHYEAALGIWPALINPARMRLALGARTWTAPERSYRRFRHRLGLVRKRLGLGREPA
jgi:glycosyltransferase involved in cell wall biosynthesis